LVRGLGSGVVWHGHSGENELLADSCCARPGCCASELAWNSTTWCEASFAPLTCELLNGTKRKKRKKERKRKKICQSAVYKRGNPDVRVMMSELISD